MMNKAKMIKKTALMLTAALLIAVIALPLYSCEAPEEKGGIRIVTTIFPVYDWVREVVGDTEGIDVSILVAGGADLHSYQPSAADILSLTTCDLVVSIGGESDLNLKTALEKNPRKERRELSLIEAEDVTVLQVSDEHIAHGDSHDHSHSPSVGTADEHIWLSADNAIACVKAIRDTLCALAPDLAESFEANAENYLSELSELKGEIGALSDTLSSLPDADKTLVFADRFPFIYLAHELSLPCFAAFDGCSSDADADFETVARLAKKLDELEIGYVFVTESSDRSLAESVIGATGEKSAEILVLDSMQSLTKSDIEGGAGYIELQRSNLGVISKAFAQS